MSFPFRRSFTAVALAGSILAGVSAVADVAAQAPPAPDSRPGTSTRTTRDRIGRHPSEPVATFAPATEWDTRSDRARQPLLAQTVTAPNVDALTYADSGVVPPGSMGAVGPSQFLVAVDGRIRTLSKATGVADGAINQTLDAFFDSVRDGFDTTFPRVRYDRHSGRWFVTAMNLGFPNRYLLAVSSGGVLSSASWTFHFWVNARTQEGAPANPCIADYPTLGVDEDALYIGANQFCGATEPTATYDSSSAYVVKKAPLLTSASLQVVTFDELSLGTGAGLYAPQGVDNFDAGTNVGYFIGVDNAVSSRLQIRRVNDPGGTPTLSADLTLNVATTASPISVPHPGGLANLDALDDALQQAVIRGGRLWTNHQIRVNATGAGSGAGDRNGIRWYELENLSTTPAVRQSGTLFDSAVTNPASYFYGSVMVNGQGHMALGATVAGATTYVNAVAAGRLAGDPLNTLNGPAEVYSPNTSFTYNVEPPPDPQRWGSYSYTSLDPADDMTLWTLQQYVNATDSYALRLARLAAPPPATVTTLTPSSIGPNVVGQSITVTGTTAAGSGFFDGGPGFSGRLVAAFSGSGVTVTGVTVVSPTELTLTVTTAGAARGARTLTVTNPDGQTATLVAALTVDNAAPVASADTYATAFGVPLTVPAAGVLGNDTDGNADSLTASVVVGPASGVLTLNANGGFVYTPNSGFTGTDAFTYQASDGIASSTAATVTISVGLNSPPSITAPAAQSLIDNGGGASTGALSFTVGDIDGSPVTVTASSSNQAVVADGAVVLGGSGASRTVAVTTVPGAVGGTSTITLTASDGQLSTHTAFTVTVVPLRGRPQALTGIVARTAVTLTWVAPPFSAQAVTGYVVEAGLSPGTTAVSLPLGNVRAFSAVAPSGRYYVRVRALTSGGQSAPSDEVVVATGQAAPPLAPLGLLATVQGTSVAFAWRENPLGTEITQYELHAGTSPGASNLGVLPLSGATTTFAAAAPAGTYYVRIVAANASGAGPASNEAAVTLGAGICTIPELPTGLAATTAAGAVNLRWDAPSAGAIPTGYRLEAGTSAGTSGIGVLALPPSTTIGGALPSGTYYVRLAATNACGSSAVTADVRFVVP